MQEKLRQSDFRGSEYCFVNQLLWGQAFGMEAAQVEGFLCTVYRGRKGYLAHDFPVGAGRPYEAVKAVWEDDRQQGCITVFRGVPEQEKEWMEQTFLQQAVVTTNRGEWDYLYSVEALQRLSGRKYHSKRNHAARFQAAGAWTYEEMSRENIPACQEMYQNWLQENQTRLDTSMEQEKKVIEGCFQYFQELQLQGGVIKQEDKTVAFCIGEPLNSDTFIVHIEKAYSGIQGAYPMINQQFAIHNMKGFHYVNREDDLGLEGLRKAKMSYHPEIILEKYNVRMTD